MKLLLPAVIAAVGLLLGGALAWQTHRLDAVREDYARYQAQVEVLGQEAEKRRIAKEAADQHAKELTDAENAANTARLNATVARLRKQAASGGGLAGGAAAAGGPDKACYDRAQLAGALRALDEGVLGLLAEGDQAVADLNSARRWAQAR